MLALGLALGCGQNSNGGDAGVGCTRDVRADTYAARLSKPGRSGALTFELVSSEPAPPARGDNRWVLRVLDASSAAVTGATLTVSPFMPDHGHGTSVAPQVTASGDSYEARPLNLFMPGLWQTTVGARTANGNDEAVFSFCIEG